MAQNIDFKMGVHRGRLMPVIKYNNGFSVAESKEFFDKFNELCLPYFNWNKPFTKSALSDFAGALNAAYDFGIKNGFITTDNPSKDARRIKAGAIFAIDLSVKPPHGLDEYFCFWALPDNCENDVEWMN